MDRTLRTLCSIRFDTTEFLIIVLDKYSDEIQKEILKLKPKNLLCLDSLFSGDDCLKTNAILKLEQEGIDFHSI